MAIAARRPIDRTRGFQILPAVLILTFASLAPLAVIGVFSFLTPGDNGGVVWNFSLKSWFNVIAERDFFTEQIEFIEAHLVVFWRSIRLSFLTTAVTLLLGFPTAYFIATRPKAKRDLWMMLIMVPFWTNLLLRTFAIMQLIRNEGIINTVLLRFGLIEQPIQMLYTEFAIMLGMTYVYLPLMVLPIYASMERFDFRLLEAGYDLYARRGRVLWEIILPLVKPGIVAGSILVFVPCLGDYVITRVLGGGKQLMLGNLIGMQFDALKNWPLGAALSMTLLLIVGIAMVFYVRTTSSEEVRHG